MTCKRARSVTGGIMMYRRQF